jgi:predicted P-loop ATPase
MQNAGLLNMGLDNIFRAVTNYARRNKFHPVRDYLDSLQWDGVDRSTWLHLYCGADDTEINQTCGFLFVISMVARIYKPGCKADYMLVLEGDQGRTKSMICAVLGGAWFSDSMPEVTAGKDASMHLRGKWLCEIPELHAFNRAETTHLKSFISRQHERYRPPYGRMEVEEPRQCVFIGTTNKDAYLRDETGGRRFWPVKLGTVNIDALKANRDQLMAQALAAFKDGKQWWPDRTWELENLVPLQESRYDADDAWEEPIAEFLVGKHEISFSDILDVLEFSTGNGTHSGNGNDDFSHYGGPGYGRSEDRRTPINRVSKADQNRIKSIIIKLGWERGGRQQSGRTRWVRRS